MSTFSKQLWRNIMKIKTDSDEEFVRYVLEARSEYLSLRLKQEPAIRQIYVDAAANVSRDLSRLAPGASDLTRNHLRALEKSLTREAENIRRALEGRLRSDLQQATGLGGRSLQAHMTSCLQSAGLRLDMVRVQRGFGDVNTAAVEAIWARTRNGMKLSDRIWQTSDNARDNMRSIILDGVARGRDSVQVARDLEQYVKHGAATMAGDYPGMMARIGKRAPKDLCYEAFRLARSEMSMAFMEGTYAAGRVNPAYKGVRWLLSSSHPLPDVCDDLASADLYGLGPGGYPAGDEPPYPHANCLCTVGPIAENTQEFVERLKKWRDDPSSEPKLEEWYNEVYLGQGAAQPSAPGPEKPLPQPGPASAPWGEAWAQSVRGLGGKTGNALQEALDGLAQGFEAEFGAKLRLEPGFTADLAKTENGNLREALAEIGEALGRLPVGATHNSPTFTSLRLGSRMATFGDYHPVAGQIRVSRKAFEAAPSLVPGRSSHAYETILHEVGHSVHKAHTDHVEAWVNEMWRLPPRRQGAAVWNMQYYGKAGKLSEQGGVTPYGSTDPLEDFADTWRLLYTDSEKAQQVKRAANQQGGQTVLGEPYRRYTLLRDLIKQLGWEVPGL